MMSLIFCKRRREHGDQQDRRGEKERRKIEVGGEKKRGKEVHNNFKINQAKKTVQ